MKTSFFAVLGAVLCCVGFVIAEDSAPQAEPNAPCAQKCQCDPCKCDPCECEDCKCAEKCPCEKKCQCDPCECEDCKCAEACCGEKK